ncbi:MAG: AAA family ATPase, partial [Candidatus Bathyarchaeota archaeon]
MEAFMFGDEIEDIGETGWDWCHFESTRGFPVSSNLLDWVIGQEYALTECNLVLDEWIHKMKWIQEEGVLDDWRDPDCERNRDRSLPPGPSLLLLGEPGTGKSLIGRALAAKLTDLYREEEIRLPDVLCWPNKNTPSSPRISIHEDGEGRIKDAKERSGEEKKREIFNFAFKALFSIILLIGLSFILLGITDAVRSYTTWRAVESLNLENFSGYTVSSFSSISDKVIQGSFLIFASFLLFVFVKRQTGVAKGIGGAVQSDAPKLLVDNSEKISPYVDATGHASAQLFGSIAWDPYQTGNLGTPEHQRVTAGDVHRANLGILYIDEVKNLQSFEATTLLTVLEDGELPITHRVTNDGGGTSALAVSTGPIPCLTLLVAAGNFDAVQHIHPALMDRIYGYGHIVRMNNDMPNTVENRRKYVQFIAQEAERFRLPPFSRGACEEIVNEGRRRTDRRGA